MQCDYKIAMNRAAFVQALILFMRSDSLVCTTPTVTRYCFGFIYNSQLHKRTGNYERYHHCARSIAHISHHVTHVTHKRNYNYNIIGMGSVYIKLFQNARKHWNTIVGRCFSFFAKRVRQKKIADNCRSVRSLKFYRPYRL